jgi:hypothetical protein
MVGQDFKFVPLFGIPVEVTCQRIGNRLGLVETIHGAQIIPIPFGIVTLEYNVSCPYYDAKEVPT